MCWMAMMQWKNALSTKAKFLQTGHLFLCLRSWQTWEVSASVFKQKCVFVHKILLGCVIAWNICSSCFLYLISFHEILNASLKMSRKDCHSWAKFHSKIHVIYLFIYFISVLSPPQSINVSWKAIFFASGNQISFEEFLSF